MGMGEPLANYKNVMEAVRRINTELGIGARHITISTVGLVPRIMRLSQEDIQVRCWSRVQTRKKSALVSPSAFKASPVEESRPVFFHFLEVSNGPPPEASREICPSMCW